VSNGAHWQFWEKPSCEVLMADDVPADEPLTARLSRSHYASYGTWGGQTTWRTPLSDPATLVPVPDDPGYSHAGQATCHNCGAVVTIRRPRQVNRWVLVRRRPLRLTLLVLVFLLALAISVRIGAAVLGEPDGLLAFLTAMMLVGLVTWVSVVVVGGPLLESPPLVTEPARTPPTDPRGPCSHDASLMAPETVDETPAATPNESSPGTGPAPV
jgi:hypothetical protein